MFSNKKTSSKGPSSTASNLESSFSLANSDSVLDDSMNEDPFLVNELQPELPEFSRENWQLPLQEDTSGTQVDEDLQGRVRIVELALQIACARASFDLPEGKLELVLSPLGYRSLRKLWLSEAELRCVADLGLLPEGHAP